MQSHAEHDPVLAVLRTARSHVERGAWCQHTMGVSGKRCLVGWVRELAPSNDVYEQTIYALDMVKPHGFTLLVDFNDHPSTTRRSVIRLIDRAIGRL